MSWGTCTNFCANKASVTWPYGKLGWICIRAWYADGNTCHALRGATCGQTFGDWMDVALCQCQAKGLSNAWEVKAVTTTTPCFTNNGGLRTVTLTSTTTTIRGAFITLFPWWLVWLALALCLLGLCGAILLLCFKRQPKPAPEEEETELLLSDGTQSLASDRALHMQQLQAPRTSIVQPFDNRIQPTLFDMIDSNHDGVITREELSAAARTLQVHPPMQAVQEQQMDLLTVTPWGYVINHLSR